MKVSCINCGTVYAERPGDYCSICLEHDLFLAVPETDKVIWKRPNRRGVRTIANLRKEKRRGESIPNYEELGRLPKVWKALFYGLPGSGKSTLALQIANNFPGQVLFAAIEEGFSDSLHEKIIQWEITSPRLQISDAQSLREIQHDLADAHYDLLIIDSLSLIEAPPEADIAQIWIVHATKDGDYKGDSELGHVVDLILNCKNGIATVVKNRFGLSGKEISIFGENLC